VNIEYVYADDVGDKSGIWQKISKLFRLHLLSIFRPFVMPNILAIAIKPMKIHARCEV